MSKCPHCGLPVGPQEWTVRFRSNGGAMVIPGRPTHIPSDAKLGRLYVRGWDQEKNDAEHPWVSHGPGEVYIEAESSTEALSRASEIRKET